MTSLILGFVLAGVVMGVEYILCTKLKNPLWGGIIPLLILGSTIYIFVTGIFTLSLQNLVPFFLLNSFFFGDWITGREQYKKKLQLEIEKMKVKEI